VNQSLRSAPFLSGAKHVIVSTIAYLATLVESLAGTPILLCTSYRPGYRPPWLDKSYATQIALHSLPPHDGLRVVRSALHGDTLSEHMEQMIIQKTERNPFFLKELVRAVMEHGDTATAIEVLETIHGVLSARIDRLPEAHKRLLQTAAVLGREFSPRLLGALWEDADALDALLSDLKRLEFLFERTGADEARYVFTHALTHDVAYASLLTPRRQALHATAGQILEVLYAGRLDDIADRLAYHYVHTDHATKAVVYLTLVAEKAARHYAHAEAVMLLQEALRHADQLPVAQRDHQVLDLVIRQGESLHCSGRRQELVTLFQHYQDRLARLQTPILAGRYYYWLAFAYIFLGQRVEAGHCVQRALEAGEYAQDAETLGMAHFVAAGEESFAGRVLQGVAHAQRAVAVLDRSSDPFQRGSAYYSFG
jgi:predicted ATPase